MTVRTRIRQIPRRPRHRPRPARGRHQAFFAGGCVRDLLLGVAPKDYDVATSATPDQIVALFRRRPSPSAPTSASCWSAEQVDGTGNRHRSRHLPLGRRLLRRPPAGRSPLHHRPARRRAAPRLHHQRHAARPHRATKPPATSTRPCSIMSTAATTCAAAWSAPSATPSFATPKTSCACCAPSASPPA